MSMVQQQQIAPINFCNFDMRGETGQTLGTVGCMRFLEFGNYELQSS